MRGGCAPTTVYRQVTESFHFVSKHLQWAPHNVTTTQSVRRVEKSNRFLRLIKLVRDNDPTLLVTLDERWFPFAKILNDSALPEINPLLLSLGDGVITKSGVDSCVEHQKFPHCRRAPERSGIRPSLIRQEYPFRDA
jgi:hypothetical protein